MRHTFQADQWVPHPLDLVFAFFSNPENLPRLMPPWQKARIEEATYAAPPSRPATTTAFPGIVAGAGTRMTISFRPIPYLPVRLPWDAEITEFAWNDHFCDVQHRGPFAFWKHCHTLKPETREGQPGTLIHDHVDYEMRAGALGELANKLFVPGQFKSIFAFRQKRTAEMLQLMQAWLSSR